MIITRISTPKRQPNRRRIHLDGTFAFACHLNVVARFRLREGMTLSDEQVHLIQGGEVRQECFDKAMESLQRRLHSRAELFKKLMRHEYGEATINDVLDQLVQLGYLNDEQFARGRAQSAAKHKHYGRRRAWQELLKAGIGAEIATAALDEVYNPTDTTVEASRLVEKHIARLRKLDPAVARRRLTGMLSRRGFEFDTIKSVVDSALGAEQESDRVDDYPAE